MQHDTPQLLEGHLNAFTPDHKSHVTGYGKHARVVATLPDVRGLYCRIDLKWNLPEPTPAQVLKVARHYGDAKGRWKIRSWECYENAGIERIDVNFYRA